ncbi:peptidoglycan D,D-transpeptidase FtsI family protein [Aureimonas frigidaquae]|uniref:peptidoglycan D,D-transpeptidase FtsI family protein n=1 Tax=Aureimonas frigidaquae TaxID=424757 RepID=UPI000780F484|nr:penicillin-binding transpeptidase domain-containing protein [Aureimonas frigidaquae]
MSGTPHHPLPEKEGSRLRRGARRVARLRRHPAGEAPPSNKPRFAIAMLAFCGVYAVIGGRLVTWGAVEGAEPSAARPAQEAAAPRPTLLDRNGRLLATDIRTASLYAQPARIGDPARAAELIASVLPEVDPARLAAQLSKGGDLIWLKRNVAPAQMQAILALNVEGVGVDTDRSRYYPGGSTAAHVVGHVDDTNRGMAGMEQYVDAAIGHAQAVGRSAPQDIRLSLDLRVQHALRDELAGAMRRYEAAAAGGIVLDATTGEVVAMASLPDYDPNHPVQARQPDRYNRMTAEATELGTTATTFTTAMALDSGKVDLSDAFDAQGPVSLGNMMLTASHGASAVRSRAMTVPEIFVYSSAAGAAQEAKAVGPAGHGAFLAKLGLTTQLRTELPELAAPRAPSQWTELSSLTASIGRGIATTPLQTAAAAAALLNGGYLVTPTFLPRSERTAEVLKRRVVSAETSARMRYLFATNAAHGSGKASLVEGLDVGGQTGTLADGASATGKAQSTSYLAAFPMHDPRYVVLVMLDAPKPAAGEAHATAAWNAAPTAGAIIARTAGFLGVEPETPKDKKQLLVSY